MKIFGLFPVLGEIVAIPPRRVGDVSEVTEYGTVRSYMKGDKYFYPEHIPFSCDVDSKYELNTRVPCLFSTYGCFKSTAQDDTCKKGRWVLPVNIQNQIDRLLIKLNKPNALLILRSLLSEELSGPPWSSDPTEYYYHNGIPIIMGIIGVEDIESIISEFPGRIRHLFDFNEHEDASKKERARADICCTLAGPVGES